jgi:glutathione S-transferase
VTRILYSGTRNASSWAFRAWLALRESDLEFEEQVVDIRVPQRFDNLARVGAFSPPAAVPVLVDGEAVIFDSLAIMEYANDLGGGRLLPADVRRRAEARALLAWQHSGLSGLCGALSFESAFFPEPLSTSPAEQADKRRLFDALEDGLRRSGGDYLFGDLSLADLALVPTLIRILAHLPDLKPWPLAEAWSRRLLGRPAVQEWMAEARTLPPVRPVET